AGRRLRVPDAVEGSQRSGCLIVGPALARDDDHRPGAAEAELQADVVRPQGLHLPVHEHDLARDVDAVELPPSTAADVDKLGADAARAGLGHAAERRAVVAPTADLDVGVLQSPRIDGYRLLDDVRKPRVA